MNSPQISVVMAVYNEEKFVEEAIQSILNQTFNDFEFIIINDASTDNTQSIIEAYAKKDKRIRLLRNETNQKLAASLNKGIATARAPLIARMDGDDIAHPKRLELQFKFMQDNPDISVCGAGLTVHETGNTWIPPQVHNAICAKLLFENCLLHPTVVYKKNIFHQINGYNEALTTAQDYDLWLRLTRFGNIKLANLPLSLLTYRTYPEQRKSYRADQHANANAIRKEALAHFGLLPTEEQWQAHLMLIHRAQDCTPEKILMCKTWLDHIYNHCQHKNTVLTAAMFNELSCRWDNLFFSATKLAFSEARLYFSSQFASKTIKNACKLAKRCWINK